ncbi:hypothetical protein KKH23_03855 [Patescibacteria group bacterium]|nr:hypothetical protein [Patescibacteria group bacterium]MBU0776905.1 hypothetical protein [Patescibacteria group bacterium]MBU0846300.1 hypothetical protein [Patescibacteria group bacterium]MBU0922564.1 hypothetical protein [Patescibacteria group bacterium]MBU1066555.1 hypothetical protein [Patescibacteria group bacterium]
MSDRGPNWVDYANLGANIVQAGQLAGVRDRLSELARIETNRERRIQLENELRQFIFEIEEGIERLTGYLQEAPLGVYITAHILENIFDEVGVEPATFQQFTDKDRVKQVRAANSLITENAANELSEKEVEKVRFHLKLSDRFSDLDLLISHLKASQKLPDMKKKLEKLSDEKNRGVKYWVLLIIGGFLVPLFALDYLGPNVLCWIGLIEVIGFAGLLYSSSSEEYRKVKNEGEELRKKILSSEKLHVLYEVFGEGLTISQYEEIEKETRDYIGQATEKDKDGNSLPKSLFELTFPPQIFEPEKSLDKVVHTRENWLCPKCGGGNPGNRTTCLGCNTERRW